MQERKDRMPKSQYLNGETRVAITDWRHIHIRWHKQWIVVPRATKSTTKSFQSSNKLHSFTIALQLAFASPAINYKQVYQDPDQSILSTIKWKQHRTVMMINYYEFSLIRFFLHFYCLTHFFRSFFFFFGFSCFDRICFIQTLNQRHSLVALDGVFTFLFVFVCGCFFFGDEENTEQLRHIKTMFVRNDCGFTDRQQKNHQQMQFQIYVNEFIFTAIFFSLLEIEAIKSEFAVLKKSKSI